MSGLIFKDESYAIQGAVYNVYKEIGCGFLEAVYQECLERELTLRGIPFVAQKLTYLRPYRANKERHFRTFRIKKPCKRTNSAKNT